MDFGEILDEWERETAIPQGKKKRREREKLRQSKQQEEIEKARKQEAPTPREVLAAWLDTNGVYDKDAAEGLSETPSAERRQYLLDKKPDALIDLHGLTQDKAWPVLEAFFHECKQKKLEKVLIVHGKGNHSAGNAVLRQLAQRFIEKCPYAGESGHNPARSGGSGVTWVLLK
jgi:DNA-nicking Smr family endonuclease